MNLEMSKSDLALLKMLLTKVEYETRVEIHHSKTFEYKDYLKQREKQIQDLLERLDRLMPEGGPERNA
ncbi:MAG: hypothetical protein AB1640_02285 [bacterium]